MRICATYGSKVPLRAGSDMHEIRMDVFDSIPDRSENIVMTLCGRDTDIIPTGFEGLVDTGERDVSIPYRRIRSFHDFNGTPDKDGIVSMLSEGEQDISKGAFMTSSFTDLHSIMEASKALKRKHVILGMGEIGKVTRIRQSLLGNEFTFGYVGTPTAPGQLSADELEKLGDDCSITGIVGHPVSHSASPAMHNAAFKAMGINGIYLRFDSPDVEHLRDVIIGYDIRGMNVTIPYKQTVMEQMDSLSEAAERIGAVNTIINDRGNLRGDNTDHIGIRYAFSDIDLENKRVLIMGTGGAARAAAYTFKDAGSVVSVSGRTQSNVDTICKDFDCTPHHGDIDGFDIIVNCTPIGLVEGVYPSDIGCMSNKQIVFDMVYGRDTPLIIKAKDVGCRIIDGKEMLIGQGAESFRLWFGKEPDHRIMRDSI